MFTSVTEWKHKNPKLKQSVLFLMMNPVKTWPRLWLHGLQFLFIKKGSKYRIYCSVRKCIKLFNGIHLGNISKIENYGIFNNVLGDISIGDHTIIGINNTIIVSAQIGNNVNLVQNVGISALYFNYEDITTYGLVKTVPFRLGHILENMFPKVPVHHIVLLWEILQE